MAAAFDKETGEIAWKVGVITRHRPNAITAMRRRWSFNTKGRSLPIWGAEHLTIHNAPMGRLRGRVQFQSGS